jgi:hypothetical protein
MNDRLPPIETDPLGAIRKELLTAAWRQKAVRDRRRRTGTVLATVMVTLVTAVSGAAALGLSAPFIGDALDDIIDLRGPIESSPDRDPSLPIGVADLKPGPGNSTEPLTFPWGNGEGSALAAAYLNRLDHVCFVVDPPNDREFFDGCSSPAVLAQRLGEAAAFLLGVRADESVVVTGYVAATADDVQVEGPQGAMNVQISEPWTPDVPGAPTLRAFVASASAQEATRSDGGNAIDPRSYTISVRLQDGRTVTVHR